MYSILGLLLFILIVILLVILFGNGSALQPTDYCHAPLCDKGVVHVACNPNLYNKFAPNCVSPKQITMDGPLQQVILDQHNVLRSQVATGNLTGFPAASNMQEMTWDPELAYIAGFNVRTCKFKHDACRSTSTFPYSGQNLAYAYHSHSFADPKTILISTIFNWFGEYKVCPVELVKGLKRISQTVGHFTVMVNQKSGRIGCAMTQFRDQRNSFATLLACNYAYNNVVGVEIYATGLPCSKCAAGCSTKHKGLCVGKN